MTGTASPEVLRQMLVARRRSTVWWSAGLSALVLFVVAAYPSVRDSSAGFDSYLGRAP
jgi:hypothetical protein